MSDHELPFNDTQQEELKWRNSLFTGPGGNTWPVSQRVQGTVQTKRDNQGHVLLIGFMEKIAFMNKLL